MEVIFFISAAVIFYAYIGYPLLLILFSRNQQQNANTDNKPTEDDCPEITVVLAAYNGEQRIRARLDNLLATDYPQEKLHIILVSDGSTDNTVAVARAYDYPRLSVMAQEQNLGKAAAINLAMAQVSTPLVAFADLRQDFAADALTQMCRHFDDPAIGAVTGNLMIEQNQNDGASTDPGLYWKYEKAIRHAEGQINSVVGVTGAIYMIRSQLFTPLQQHTILDDVFTPMCIVKAGKRVVMANDALAFDSSSHSVKEEFGRKVRTLAGNYQLMKIIPWINNPFKNPIFWQWFSHKVCRLLVPFALILLFASCIVLQEMVFTLLLALQLVFYACAYYGYKKLVRGKNAGIFNVPATFTILNIAAFIALFKHLFSTPEKLWKKR
ncbi:glycosyltransferase family 2 protein [Thalassomonas haliotis]|uniref:Glycosyltransferase family 2 protein n=1 Tax=Thalassomonas haliotis TaxID=485448 RepID=A0ABY7VGC4_9GAMM|nr:glycosyltransferase family 2 protein [Thalassomonas haliotis]WDE12249.1 glycosyltransferase family 2 protein [Thalassomonas haliotis]